MLRKFALVLLLLLSCDPAPTYTLDNGVRVWVDNDTTGDYTKANVDLAIAIFKYEFKDRFKFNKISEIRVEFLDVVTYVDPRYPDGHAIAGHTEWTGDIVYVAAHDTRLWDGSLMHELVHACDILETGTTDATHKSWANDVFHKIDDAKLRLKSELDR